MPSISRRELLRVGGLTSLGLSLHVELDDESRRADFMADVQHMAQILAHKYGATSGDNSDDDGDAQPSRPRFRLVLACYPKS